MRFDLFGFVPIVIIWIALVFPVLVIGLSGRDYFGRLGGQPIGPRVDVRWGWFFMELPALCVLPFIYFRGAGRHVVSDLLVAVWIAHYAHRTMVWPWIVQRYGKPMPVITCVSGFTFNIVNGLLFGWFLTRLADYPNDWFGDPRFIIGAATMLFGATLNVYSDYRLARLRHKQSGQYVLPHGGPFKFISCPNLTGEMIEWIGFALMSWSLPGLAFVIWTAANMIPRALWRHRWYSEQFADYPKDRRAVIPQLL